MRPVGTMVRRGRWWLALVLAVGVASCSEPSLPESASEQVADEDVLTDAVPDPSRDALVVMLTELTDTLTAARDALDAAADAGQDAAARDSVAAARAHLLDGTGTSSTPGVFPSVTVERSDADGAQDDLLTATLTLARETGGDLGNATVETLRDPLAGDLGAWERDAEGMVEAIAATVAGDRDTDAVADAVMDLPGDGARALAWTTLAQDTDDPEVRRAAAERASGHLSVVLVALSLPTGTDAAS